MGHPVNGILNPHTEMVKIQESIPKAAKGDAEYGRPKDGENDNSICPVCKQTHTRSKDGVDNTSYSTRLYSCNAFLDMSLNEKAEFIESRGGCAWCLDWTGYHKAIDCKNRGSRTCLCGRIHHSLLHGTKVAYCTMGSSVLKSTRKFESRIAVESTEAPEVDAETKKRDVPVKAVE